MRYQVRFVDDAALPKGVEWAFARLSGVTYLFVKESAIDTTTGHCEALTTARECWQAIEGTAAPSSRLRSEVGHLRNVTAVLAAGFGLPVVKLASAVL